MARKDGQLNFAALAVGDKFKYSLTGIDVYTKTGTREATDSNWRKFKASPNVLVIRA